jgi:hypothetical protein
MNETNTANSPIDFYKGRLQILEPEIKNRKQTSRLISAVRVIVMLCCLWFLWQCIQVPGQLQLYGTLAAGGFAVFLLLVRYHMNVLEKEKLLTSQATLNRQEIAYLNNGTLPGKEGTDFINAHHAFTYDLDIFGKRSLFHHINRTVTGKGYEELGNLFNSEEAGNVPQKQQAIKELSQKPAWRQMFTAQGMGVPADALETKALLRWLQLPLAPVQPVVKVLMYVLPAALLSVLIAGTVSDFDVWPWLTWLFIGNLAVVGINGKQLKQQHALLNNAAPVLAARAAMLRQLESEKLQSSLLQQIQSVTQQPLSAATAVKQLSGLLDRFDKMYNVVSALVTNGLFQYHNHSLVKLHQWKQTYGAQVENWLTAIAQTDALNSLANYTFNHPAFQYPVVVAEGLHLSAADLGHPLLNPSKRVSNSIEFNHPQFYILTGSNMAGKSTFLRTLGINLVMANMGLPVCAARFEYYPFRLFSCMRIDDSLLDSESYFYAELKRLHQLIELLHTGQPYFILLDEILRGTNSDDKYSGTIGLVKQLMEQKAWGMLATHDLKVSELEKDYPGAMGCCCFEAGHVNGQLVFDYKLRPGVSAQKSATTLMLQMGIIKPTGNT